MARAPAPGGLPPLLPALLLASSLRASFAVETFRVALISDFTGSWRPASGPFAGGFKDFAVPYMNAQGITGYDGASWQVEIVSYDTQSMMQVREVQEEIRTAIAAGQDLEGNAVGEIHLIVAATGMDNAHIKAMGEALGIANVHTTGSDPRTWDSTQTFAYSMHSPFTEYTKPIIDFVSQSHKTVALITSSAHPYAKNLGISALKWIRGHRTMTVVGPSVAWCRAHSAEAGECELVTTGGQERCVCGSQADVDSFGFGYQLEDAPTAYGIDESLLGDGLQSNVVDDATVAFVRGMLQDIREQLGSAPDLLLNFAFEHHNVLKAMVDEKFEPAFVAGWQLGTDADWAEDDSRVLSVKHGLWALGFHQWHRGLNHSDSLFGSSQRAQQLFKEQRRYDLDSNEASGVAVGSMLYHLLSSWIPADFSSLSGKQDLVRKAIGEHQFPTLLGLASLRPGGGAARDGAVWQILPEDDWVQSRAVMPAALAEAALQFPFPSFESRFGCAAGFFNTKTECAACAAGTFKASGDAGLVETQCDACPAGSYTSREGATQCVLCPAGSHAPDGGAAECVPCGPDTYADSEGATSCLACPAGLYAETAGASDGSECKEKAPGKAPPSETSGGSRTAVLAGAALSAPLLRALLAALW